MLSKSEVKYIQSLQQKKFRDSHGVFVAEGPKVVGELLALNTFSLKKIYAVEEWFLEHAVDLKISNDQVCMVKDHELEKISLLKTPHQVLAVFIQKEDPAFLPSANKLTLLLDDIRDPGNFGTIIRIADWFGIEDVVCSMNCVDMYNPKVVQSTMASLGRVNVHYHSLLSVVEKFHNIPLYATALNGLSLDEISVPRGSFILVGNEGSGVSEQLLAKAKEKITIPGEGNAESLNAAVATGIVLYSLTRPR